MRPHVLLRADGLVEIRPARRRFPPPDPGRFMRACSVLGLIAACGACKVLGPGVFLAVAGFVVTATLTAVELLALARPETEAAVLRHPRGGGERRA